MTAQALTSQGFVPEDVTEWLRGLGWTRDGSLGHIAQSWRRGESQVMVPTLATSPDFTLRWSEMLTNLSRELGTDAAGVLLAVAKSGSDIAEFRASGQFDDTLPLGDASTLIESVRRAIQASANSALQPRSYFGHSVPDAARLHASGVRMAQTRHGSYIVPVISRLPVLKPDDVEDARLFEDVEYQPFARRAMLRLAEGLSALRDLTHGPSAPAPSSITEAVGVGVSSELCEAVANTLDTSSIASLQVAFAWADRLPAREAPTAVVLAGQASTAIRQVGEVLKGSPVIGRQTIVGYVKRLDRGEEDEVGRVTLRALDNDKARNISLELNDSDYHVASVANTDRRIVSATGILHREPGRILRFSEVSDFGLVEQLSLAPSDGPAK